MIDLTVNKACKAESSFMESRALQALVMIIWFTVWFKG
ncbi:hypothetical protein PaelaDRAFT_5109 [Paenibacillus lactis 154]|uniref:Uncharacterized protein n=1 Tax=Paenibacillus lactis 154 TaxID=743719 RepID=G4HM98_9BACL|nr:hypothetical protein PaelaDRAFT_5109 [Paenibacillus lactis 154]